MHVKVGPDGSESREGGSPKPPDCNPDTVCEAIKALEGALTRYDGLRRSCFRDNGAAAQSASGNVGRLPDEDFCADLDAVVEVDHVGVIETKASR
jgi:hypothetical protein